MLMNEIKANTHSNTLNPAELVKYFSLFVFVFKLDCIAATLFDSVVLTVEEIMVYCKL